MNYNTIATKTISDIQSDALKIYGKYDLEKSMIWMTEEFGEVIQAIRKGKRNDDISEEIGDLLAWIFCIANILELNIENSVQTSFSKEINRQLAVYGRLKYCSTSEIHDLYSN